MSQHPLRKRLLALHEQPAVMVPSTVSTRKPPQQFNASAMDVATCEFLPCTLQQAPKKKARLLQPLDAQRMATPQSTQRTNEAASTTTTNAR